MYVFMYVCLFQIYVIHGVSDKGLAYPAVYGLLKDKSAMSYSAMFDHVCKLVPDGPDHVVVDLEQAPISLYPQYWPETVVEGCLFHFKRALRIQLSNKGILTFYNSSVILQSTIERFKSLAFVPKAEIQEAFEEAVEPLFNKVASDLDCPDKLKNYLTYLEKTYVGLYGRNGKRKNPNYPPKIWSKYQATLDGRLQTSNASEVWHRNIQDAIDTSSTWKFMKFIKEEDALMAHRLDQDTISIKYQTAPGSLEGGSRKIHQRDKAERMFNVVKQWGTVPNDQYLKLVSSIQRGWEEEY